MAVGFGEAYESTAGFGRSGAPTQESDGPEGARLFESACTLCHDLGGITENPGVYTETAFRNLVIAMVDYGAPLDEEQIETLVGYLTTTYGKKSQ